MYTVICKWIKIILCLQVNCREKSLFKQINFQTSGHAFFQTKKDKVFKIQWGNKVEMLNTKTNYFNSNVKNIDIVKQSVLNTKSLCKNLSPASYIQRLRNTSSVPFECKRFVKGQRIIRQNGCWSLSNRRCLLSFHRGVCTYVKYT